MNNSSSLNIIFAGTPDFAATHLEELLSTHHNIVAVYTQPDKPAGRGKKITESPVKQLANQHNIPVFQPKTLKDESAQNQLASLNADIMIVVAYGLILPKAVLEMPKLGCLNVHGSLLPKWRGAAPIQRACWAGDKTTGITIMQMNEGLDTGDILHQVSCVIEADDTSASLYLKLAELGKKALIDALEKLCSGEITPIKQNDLEATYAQKLSKAEAKLNWALPANELERCVRAFNPWPVSYFELDNQMIKVWQADVIDKDVLEPAGTIINADKTGIQVATSCGIINLTKLQPAGKKPMSAAELLNSRQSWFTIGKQL